MNKVSNYNQIKNEIYSEIGFKRKKQSQLYWNAVKEELVRLHDKNRYVDIDAVNNLYKSVAMHQKLEGEEMPKEIKDIFSGKTPVEKSSGIKIIVGDPKVSLSREMDFGVELDKYSIIPAIKKKQYKANRTLLLKIEKIRAIDNIYALQNMYKSELKGQNPDTRILTALNKRRSEMSHSLHSLALRTWGWDSDKKARYNWEGRNFPFEYAMSRIRMSTSFSKKPKERELEIKDALSIYRFEENEIKEFSLYGDFGKGLGTAEKRVSKCVSAAKAFKENNPNYMDRDYFKYLQDKIKSIKATYPALKEEINIRLREAQLMEEAKIIAQQREQEEKEQRKQKEYEELRERHSQNALDENMVMDTGRYLGR